MPFFIMKIPSKRELQQIASNLSADIDFKDFIKIYKKILQNDILLWLIIQLYKQISFNIFKKSFKKKYTIKKYMIK